MRINIAAFFFAVLAATGCLPQAGKEELDLADCKIFDGEDLILSSDANTDFLHLATDGYNETGWTGSSNDEEHFPVELDIFHDTHITHTTLLWACPEHVNDGIVTIDVYNAGRGMNYSVDLYCNPGKTVSVTFWARFFTVFVRFF